MAEKDSDIRQEHAKVRAVEESSRLPAGAFHSDEVQEIMGRRPGWILRWGVTVLVGIFAGIITACCLIKYPQTVTAAITLTSDCPPSDLAARCSGILDSVYVRDGDTVGGGALLALIASTAVYDDVLTAEGILAGAGDSSCADGLRLGDLQQYWISYRAACSDYDDYLQIDRTGKKQKLLAGQVWRAKEYYARLESQRATKVRELEYEWKKVSRDSVLLSLGAISEKEFEASRQAYVSMESSLDGFDATMAAAHLDRLQIEQQILELDTERSVEEAEYRRKIEQAAETFRNRMALWKEQYTITAPYGGIVSLQNVWGKGQMVSTGDIIASIAPAGGLNVIGRLKVPSASFGKVTEGQEVNIKLNGFPYLEYGILKGTVAGISRIPEKTQEGGITYTVDVALPEGLESTYHKTFPFVQNMDGTADIITEDLRLIDRFIQPVRSLFVNR